MPNPHTFTGDPNLWKHIRKDTELYKLTWKRSYAKEIDGKPTFYGMLLDSKLKRMD